jgi:hypothetical protein
MIVVGIDPGLRGALCILGVCDRPEFFEAGPVHPILVQMPVTSGKRPDYNLSEIEAFLENAVKVGLSRLYVERSQPLPPSMGGSLANFHRGRSLALWETMCHCLRIPIEFVPPQTWQREMLAGCSGADTKARALQAAQRLFPGLELRRTPKCKKPDEGFCDALLVAEYGRRKMAKG